MLITKFKDEIGNHSIALKSQGKKVAFVPTMGALHQGHLSLIEVAKQNADEVVVSIYVNPTQFAPNEDFGSYPRNLKTDIEMLFKAGVGGVFTPDEAEIYPDGKPEAKDIVKQNADILCGKSRPHFFHGVWAVVSRLFDAVKPDVAVFGEKDFQQLQIIRQMSLVDGFDINIIGAPIIRESSGLAMSSRNKYLSTDEAKTASTIYAELKKLATSLEKKPEMVLELIKKTKDNLLSCGFDNIDYLELRDSESLAELKSFKDGARLFFAGHLGKTRLIDNYKI